MTPGKPRKKSLAQCWDQQVETTSDDADIWSLKSSYSSESLE